MLDTARLLEFLYYYTGAVLSVVGLFIVFSFASIKRRERWFYAIFLLLPLAASIIRSVLMLGEANVRPPEKEKLIWVLLELMYVPCLPCIIAFLVHMCGEPLRKNRTFFAICAVGAVNALMIIFFATAGEPYSISQEGTISVTPAIIPGVMTSAAAAIIAVTALVTRWRLLTGVQRLLFVICFLTYSSPASLAAMLLLLMINENRHVLNTKEELAREKTKVAVLQMRPHFIYNTLMSIYHLCGKDDEKAKQVILDFSRYLRTNFTAVAAEENVPFSDELEHTRAYLAVEKARFQDRLIVDFNTPVADFRLPPLTLQPLVENAVKYGLSQAPEPLRINVSTKGSDSGTLITVEDSGPGYAPKEDGAEHIALDNIRSRLKTMCSGTLNIATRPEGGTRAEVFIPKNN